MASLKRSRRESDTKSYEDAVKRQRTKLHPTAIVARGAVHTDLAVLANEAPTFTLFTVRLYCEKDDIILQATEYTKEDFAKYVALAVVCPVGLYFALGWTIPYVTGMAATALMATLTLDPLAALTGAQRLTEIGANVLFQRATLDRLGTAASATKSAYKYVAGHLDRPLVCKRMYDSLLSAMGASGTRSTLDESRKEYERKLTEQGQWATMAKYADLPKNLKSAYASRVPDTPEGRSNLHKKYVSAWRHALELYPNAAPTEFGVMLSELEKIDAYPDLTEQIAKDVFQSTLRKPYFELICRSVLYTTWCVETPTFIAFCQLVMGNIPADILKRACDDVAHLNSIFRDPETLLSEGRKLGDSPLTELSYKEKKDVQKIADSVVKPWWTLDKDLRMELGITERLREICRNTSDEKYLELLELFVETEKKIKDTAPLLFAKVLKELKGELTAQVTDPLWVRIRPLLLENEAPAILDKMYN
jgi:hypothetical protein